jgi:Tol biopolymer transport system component
MFREASGALIAQDIETGETYRQEVDFNQEIVIAAQCSDDGSKIAYLRQDFDSVDRVLDIRGEDAPDDPITVPATTQGFAWSPDGATIAIADYDGQAQDHRIKLLALDSGDETLLSEGEGFSGYITFSPDGSRIAYNLQTIADGVSRIMEIPAKGGDPEELAPGGDQQWYDPDWSPDGTVILVAGGSPDGFQLYEINADSGESSAITDSEIFKRGAQYSPDGDTIAYTGSIAVPGVSVDWRADLHQFGIFLTDGDGSNERAFTTDPRLNPGAAVDPYLDAYFIGWCTPGAWLDDLWEPGEAATPSTQ